MGRIRRKPLCGTDGADRVFGWDRTNEPGDFGPGDDNDAWFGGLGGDLPSGGAGQFVAGRAALDAGDRNLYDAATGQVRYDADGLGGRVAVLVVTVNEGAGLTFADFAVV